MNSKAFLIAAVTLFSGFVSLSPAQADAVVGNFTIENGVASASGGQVIFTLDANGQISATLTVTGLAGNIVGFGFNSAALNLPESNFSVAPNNPFGWVDMYGGQASGFLCTSCTSTESWTIGNPGDFSSVYDVLNGGGQSQYDFFLFDSNEAQWAADAAPYSAVPEPGTLALFGAALLALGGLSLRRKSV